MDNRNSESDDRQKDQLRVDLLAEKVELYRTMALTFFNRLNKEEKIDALLEVVSILKAEE